MPCPQAGFDAMMALSGFIGRMRMIFVASKEVYYGNA